MLILCWEWQDLTKTLQEVAFLKNKIKEIRKMKKNLFRIAALALVGACMTACSSGDDEATNEKVNPQPKKDNIVVLKGSLGSAETRSIITEDASGANAIWKSGDLVKIRYEQTPSGYGEAVATISGSGSIATYTATLTNPKNGGTIYYVYPASCYSSSAGAPFISTSGLASQAGTLEDIGNNRNIQTGNSTMNITNNVAVPASNPLKLTPQVCIAKFNLKTLLANSAYGEYPATKLIVADGTNTYTVTPTAATSTFYVAMLPLTTSTSVTLTATGNTLTAVKNLAPSTVALDASTDVGKIIGVERSTNQAKLYTRGTGNLSKTYAKTTLSAGGYYPQDVPIATDVTPIAVITHVGAVEGYCQYFIALALEDVTTSYVNSTAGRTAINQWMLNHGITIEGNPYNAINPVTESVGYDLVEENSVENLNKNKSASSDHKDTTTKPWRGWRVPTITDWRYTFESLCEVGDADSPLGIADRDVYPHSSSSDVGSTCRTKINEACGNEGIPNVPTAVYWTGSYLTREEESQTVTKIWRYGFNDGRFEWVSPNNNSHIRMCLAY